MPPTRKPVTAAPTIKAPSQPPSKRPAASPTKRPTRKEINDAGNEITVKSVVRDRKDIFPRCFAHSMEEAWTCLKTARTAFICDRPATLSSDQSCNPDESVLVVKNAVVVDRRGVIMDTENGTIYDVSGGCCIKEKTRWKQGDKIVLPKNRDSQSSRPLVLLAHSHDETYYHFTMEVLGRLLQVDFVSHAIRQGLVDFFVSFTTSFHRKYLDLLLCGDGTTNHRKGSCYDRNRLGKVIQTGEFPAILLPPSHEHNNYTRLREVLHQATAQAACSMPRKNVKKFIVLKRETSRRVVNLGNLVGLLQATQPDIEFVLLSDSGMNKMNLIETARLFCDAHGLIGGHGAGLTNMIWLRPPQNMTASLLQIIRKGQGGNVYPDLARQLDIEYADLLSCTRLVNETLQSNYADTVVDMYAAVKILRPFLS